MCRLCYDALRARVAELERQRDAAYSDGVSIVEDRLLPRIAELEVDRLALAERVRLACSKCTVGGDRENISALDLAPLLNSPGRGTTS